MESRSPTTGQLVASRYRVGAFIGRGNMGEVYVADDIDKNTQVAIKFLTIRGEQLGYF